MSKDIPKGSKFSRGDKPVAPGENPYLSSSEKSTDEAEEGSSPDQHAQKAQRAPDSAAPAAPQSGSAIPENSHIPYPEVTGGGPGNAPGSTQTSSQVPSQSPVPVPPPASSFPGDPRVESERGEEARGYQRSNKKLLDIFVKVGVFTGFLGLFFGVFIYALMAILAGGYVAVASKGELKGGYFALGLGIAGMVFGVVLRRAFI